MFRPLLVATAIAAFSFVSLSAERSVAQIAFNPPLTAPTPVDQPISFRLAAGSKVECVDQQSIEGMPAPPEPPFKYAIAVEAVGADLRLRLLDPSQNQVAISVLVDKAGSVKLENAEDLKIPAALGRQLIESLLAQLPELRLNGRRFKTGDSVLDPKALQGLFTRLFRQGGLTTPQLQITGGSTMSGESRARGRRVAIFTTDVKVTEPSSGGLSIKGVEAFDVQTGLRVYVKLTMRFPAPAGAPAKEAILRQETICSVTDG